jgi:hypothetical protein
VKVFLGGEGPDDLGDWYREPQYRSRPPVVGIVEALLHRVAGADFTVIGACVWKRIRKYRFGRPLEAETRNVLGLMIEAGEVGADVLVFVRDQDGDAERGEAVVEGVRLARERDQEPAVVGGVAVQEIEAWILALLGERRTELHTDAKAVIAERHQVVDRAGKVAVVEGADLGRVPEDAASLRAWLSEAASALAAKG